jgi:hypothetical protein
MSNSNLRTTAFNSLVGVATILASALVGCGGSSSSSEPETERLAVVSPTTTTFRAADSFMLEVETTQFTLSAPPDLSAQAANGYTGSLARTAINPRVLHETAEEHPHDEAGNPIEVTDSHSHDDIMTTSSEEHSDEHSETAAHDDSEAADGHDHDSTATNPAATQGHMHIYLDGGSGSDKHVTSWSNATPITLPADIAPGMHSLRIELRDDSHTVVDPESDQFLMFEIVE